MEKEHNKLITIVDKNTELVPGNVQEADHTVINWLNDDTSEVLFVYAITQTGNHVDKAGIAGRIEIKNQHLAGVAKMFSEYVTENNLH